MDSSLINETSYELLQSTLSGIKKEVEELQNQIHQQHLEIEQSEEARLNFWLLIAATNILLMQAGFALLEVGTVQAKNAKSILFKNLVDCCTGVIIWWLFGYAISQGGFTEPKPSNFGNLVPEEAVYFFHSFTYSTTCATIISGGVAERISFAAYMALAGTMVGLFYPLMAYWCWGAHGFLYELGYTDFAGSGVIHALGGIATLVSAWMLGPRIGRFNVDVEKGQVEVHEFKGHSPVLSALGTFILLFGWFSFNASSTLGADVDHFMLSSRAAVNTMLAAAAASLTGIVWRQKETGVHDLAAVNNTLLCGAVSITGCCAYVDFWVAPIIGALSTVGYYCASTLSMSFKIDDPLDAFAVHGGGGIWGVIATALFVNPKYLDEGRPGGLIYGSGIKLLGAQMLGLVVMTLWSVIGYGLAVYLLNRLPGFQLRTDKDAELLGLDFAYHDGFAYPDFNKHSIITFNEMKMAEKRVEARHKGKRQHRRKVVDLTTITTTPKKKRKEKCIGHAGGTSLSNSSFSDSYDTSTASNDSFHSPIATMETVTLNSITTRPNTPSRRCTMMGNFALNYSVTSHPNLLCRSRSSSKQCQNPLDIRRHVGNYPLDQDDEIKQERQHIDNVAPSFAKEETLPNNIPANLKISCTSSPTSLHSKNKGLMNHNSTYNSRVEE
mmetsp:Transcript_36374/g.47991  ORF Transcript_36374/g.47991 Transcript_36374/m.47991 type:complete len:666 (+) Transcript_36374:632-2629(+)